MTIHELSDIRILPGDRLLAVSDRGYWFEGRLLFDDTTRLSGLEDARVMSLVGQRGEPLAGLEADAEGLDILPNGGRLVSFERNHRIWHYPADGRPPRPVPWPDAPFPANRGMEALAHYPAAGSDAYLVGSEDGEIWLCSLAGTCDATAFGRFVPVGFGLTALAAFGDTGSFAMLARAYDPRHGIRVSVRLVHAIGDGGVLDELTLAAPFSVDNFEGLAVVPRPPERMRLYLVSDDNGSETQRTFLFAFDWQR